MTSDDLLAAQARIAEVDTEVASLSQTERDCIDKAREFNEACRTARSKRTALLKAIEPVKAAVAQHLQEAAIEAKRFAREMVEREAGERESQRQAAEQSELEKLRQENSALKEKLNVQG